MDDDILDEKMLKLILQSITENAIYHGLEPKPENGSLWIKAYREKEHMIFSVEDKGEESKNGRIGGMIKAALMGDEYIN